MKEQLLIQSLLQNKFLEFRKRNAAFSLRAFSKKLGISSGAMSELMNGQRHASRKLVLRILERLLLDPQERAEILQHFPPPKKSRRRERDYGSPGADSVDPSYLQLTADQFRIVGDWWHFAILSLLNTQGFKNDPEWIASRLGLSPSIVGQALERLKRLEMVAENADGTLKRRSSRFRTTDDVTSLSIRKAHHQYLDKAQTALGNVPMEKRDFTSIMMAINPERLPEAKEKIRRFQDELAKMLEIAPQAEVYQLCVQLFPLSAESNVPARKEVSYET